MSLPSTATTARLVLTARDLTASLGERHAAFTQLVQQSQHIVFALALSSLRDVEDARDVSQNAFATAWHRLGQLRDPAVFEAWLKSIVVRECARRRRRLPVAPEAVARDVAVESAVQSADYQDLIAAALEDLPEHERHVTVLFYFLGYSQPQIARLLHLKPGTVGKRLHTARLRMRRRLPQWVRSDFVRQLPSVEFAARVRRGLLDEYIGEYRFDQRPDDIVIIAREGDSLVGTAGGQRHVLMSSGGHSLLTRHYDGEGRFRRDRRGRVTSFVYYEFGRRLGIARKL
jgi:RNA polymerase sigma-70 factor (ECF subfamily)